MTSSIFITGTNTGVGKTLTSALILSAAHQAQLSVNYFKPLQTGDESDCHLVKEMTGLADNFIKSPVYSLKLPASPYHAALYEQTVIDRTRLLRHWHSICHIPTVVEGCGGLLVPVAKNFLIRNLVKLLNLRLVIVANTVLGSINHTLLTIEAAMAENIPILGIILLGDNHYPWLKNSLQEFNHIPILAEIPWLNSLHQQSIQNISITLFNKNTLTKFFHEDND